MTATLSSYYKQAYQFSSQWNTLIDETESGNEQRRNQWTVPKKSWILDFEKSPANTTAMLAFFDARKGKYEAFNFVWAVDRGGDGNTYLVRFDQDSIDMDLFRGYSTFQLKIVQVNS